MLRRDEGRISFSRRVSVLVVIAVAAFFIGSMFYFAGGSGPDYASHFPVAAVTFPTGLAAIGLGSSALKLGWYFYLVCGAWILLSRNVRSLLIASAVLGLVLLVNLAGCSALINK